MKTLVATGVLVLIATFFVSSIAPPGDADEAGSDHHEHPGLTDASPLSQDHSHGDSDDHHAGPGGACHHHVIHCGCAHVHSALPFPALGVAGPVISDRVNIAQMFSAATIALQNIFHIPIA